MKQDYIRTTVRLPRPLYNQIKRKALETSKSITQIMSEFAEQAYLDMVKERKINK